MTRRKIIKRMATVVILICLVAVAGYYIADSLIEKKIRAQLSEISPSIQLKFSSVHANIFLSSVSFDSIEVNFAPYSSQLQNRHRFNFSRATLKGISFLKFLFSKELDANRLSVYTGNIRLDSFLIARKDSAQSGVLAQMRLPFKKLFIRKVDLNDAKIFVNNKQVINRADVKLGGILINKPGDNPAVEAIEVRLLGMDYSFGDYRIQLKQLVFNTRGKTLKADSLYFVSEKQKRIEALVTSLRMDGFDLFRFMNEKILEAKELVIENSRLLMNVNEKAIALKFPSDVRKIIVQHFQLRSAFVLYKDRERQCSFNAGFELSGFNACPDLDKDDLHFNSIDANISDIEYAGSNYNSASIKNVYIDSKRERIELRDINVTPRVNKFEWQTKRGHQGDWMKAYISTVNITKPRLDDWLNQKFYADKVAIGESNVYIFRDRRLPRQQKNIPLPVDFLKSLPVDLRIRSCTLGSSTVEYEEYPRSGYGLTGILKIENAKATISSLINHPLPSDPACITMNVEGSIMGSGTTHGTVLMPFKKSEPYHMKGIFENVDLTKLNSSSENLGKIRIRSGFLDFLSFDFKMTDQRSTGKIIGAYHHLIIQPLKKHTKEKNVADFASFALRHAVIPLNKDKSLPESKRTGYVDYRRDPTRMVSYYYLQSLLMGVKKSFKLGFLLPK